MPHYAGLLAYSVLLKRGNTVWQDQSRSGLYQRNHAQEICCLRFEYKLLPPLRECAYCCRMEEIIFVDRRELKRFECASYIGFGCW